MTKEEKLLNMLMGDGASDGETINARNMLKKMGVKLSIGEGNQDDYNKLAYEYEKLLSKYKQVNSEYEYLQDKYYSLSKEYKDVESQQRTSTTVNEDLKKKLRDKDMEITALKFYVQTFLFFGSVFAFLFFISLVLRG